MMRFIACLFVCFALVSCVRKPSGPPPALGQGMLPEGAAPVNIRIDDQNCWSEQGQFFVTGLCSNESMSRQEIWLRVEFQDAAGKALTIKKFPSAITPVFSTGIAPKGRSAFFAGWPLSDFSGTPASCKITCAGAQLLDAGPLLLVEQISGVKMLTPKAPGMPATEEKAWQINAVLNNALPRVAAHPRLELLLYGTDKKLWLSQVLNPEDQEIKGMLSMEKTGPLQGGEKRSFGLNVYYDRLPAALQEKKIGRVEMLAFNEYEQ